MQLVRSKLLKKIGRVTLQRKSIKNHQSKINYEKTTIYSYCAFIPLA